MECYQLNPSGNYVLRVEPFAQGDLAPAGAFARPLATSLCVFFQMVNFMKKVWKIIRIVLLSGISLFILTVVKFAFFYHRYLYNLPQDIANEFPGHTAIADPDYQEAIEQGRKFVRKLIYDWNLPSMSVAVGKNGKVLWAEAFGWADLDKKNPVRAVMPYRIHSVSKPLTATAIAKLWEQGRLDLEKSIRAYLPGFPKKRYLINLTYLLSHQSGIRHYPDYACR